MTLKSCSIILGTAFVLLASSAAFTEGDLLNGSDSQKTYQLGIYNPQGSGSQTRVRQFDDRTFPGFGIEFYSIYGYDGQAQYRLNATDLLVGGNETIEFLLSNNAVKFTGGTSELTHRLIDTPSANPWVARMLAAISPAVPAAVVGTSWDTFKDLSPGQDYFMDRRVSDLNMYINADAERRVGIVAGWWNETETGQQQLLFRARQAKAGVVNNSQRAGIAVPIDRQTNEGSIGADVAIAGNSVVNYKYTNTKFEDDSQLPAKGSSLDFLPLNAMTTYSNETQSQVVKARSNITDKLQFTGIYTNRDRSNNTNGIPAGYTSAGSALNKKNKTSSTNVAMVYSPTDTLSFTGRYRDFKLDNLVPPVYASGSTTPSNLQLSTHTQSAEIEGVYTGIAKAYLRFGLENKKDQRHNSSLSGPDEQLDVPFTGSNSDHNSVYWRIQRVSLRYHPLSELNISGNYENSQAAKGEFTGTPDARKKSNFDATYMLRDNMAFFCNLSQVNESNSDIRVATAPVLPVNPGSEATAEQIAAYNDALAVYAEERDLLAGQGLNSSFKTTSIGTWYGINDRLTLDLNYGLVKNGTNTTWVLGTDSAFLPNLPAQTVAFDSNDTQWSAGANYVFSRKLKFNGGFFHSKSDGASIVDSTKFAGLGPVWTPFKVKQDRWSLGANYGLNQKDCLNFDFSIGKWSDDIDAANSGTFQVYRLAWARSY